MKLTSDFLVIGSGLAGLLSAHKLSALGTVHLLTKKEVSECNSNYAQGGIAAAIGRDDSPASHAEDTIKAGAGLCDEAIVRLVADEAPARIRELRELGVRFCEKDGVMDLGLEAAHSHRRILHAGDVSGREIIRALVQRCQEDANIRIFENHIAVNLIRDGQGDCCGAQNSRRPASAPDTGWFPLRGLTVATPGATSSAERPLCNGVIFHS